MQQPISEDDIARHEAQAVQDNVAKTEDEHEAQQGSEELAALLTHLKARFATETGSDDLDLLDFSLHHLFCRLTTLYRQVLPNLAFPPYIKLLPGDDLPYYCHTWNQLEQLRRTLSRMEALAHMLTGAATNILDTLDAANPSSTTSDNTDVNHKIRTGSHNSGEAFLTGMKIHLNDWQHAHAEHRSFSTRFADLQPSVPNLAQIDTALDTLLNGACFMYGTILHDLLIEHATTEQVATLLLDLMQQADLLLQAIDLLLDPLHALMKCFALAAEMY